jgi:folate-binding protein YgfZ
MNPDWKSFLMQAGAMVGDNGVCHFGDPERELHMALSGDVLSDLSHLGLIAASGSDAQTFLQGQLTSDVRQITPAHSQLSAYCSPKGRMLASFRLFQRCDAFYLRVLREKLEPLLNRLRMFVLRADVTLVDVSNELTTIGLSGPHATELLQKTLGTVPVQPEEVSHTENLSIIRLPGIWPRFEIYGELGKLQLLWTNLASETTLTGPEPWRLLDIAAGIPTIYPETSEAFVPQMTNLQLLGGVSFRKGCYPGQEVVARTQHLGKLKRRMYRAKIACDMPPQPGNRLYSAQLGPEQHAGIIADACRHPKGGYVVLAVVMIDCVEQGPVLLGGADGAPLVFESLPYPFDSAVA